MLASGLRSMWAKKKRKGSSFPGIAVVARSAEMGGGSFIGVVPYL